MIDTLFVREAARRLAKVQAGNILQAAFQTVRSDIKDNTVNGINELQLEKNLALMRLNQQAEVLIEGKAGEALVEKVTSIKAQMYHLDGVDGIK